MTLKDLIAAFQGREMVSPKRLERLTGLSVRSIYRWVEEGRLESYKIGDRLYLPLDQVIEVDHNPRTLPLPDRVLHLPARSAGAAWTDRSYWSARRQRRSGAPGAKG